MADSCVDLLALIGDPPTQFCILSLIGQPFSGAPEDENSGREERGQFLVLGVRFLQHSLSFLAPPSHSSPLYFIEKYREGQVCTIQPR